MAANAGLARPVPVFLKIAPDLDDRALAELTEAALDGGVAGIVATNTTLARDGLTSRHAREAGGLSGQPLFVPSTVVLAKLHAMTEGRLPLIGVGGVAHRPSRPTPRSAPAPRPCSSTPPSSTTASASSRASSPASTACSPATASPPSPRPSAPAAASGWPVEAPAPIGQCRGGRGGPARAPLGPLARRSDMEAQGRRPTAAGTEPANCGRAALRAPIPRVGGEWLRPAARAIPR